MLPCETYIPNLRTTRTCHCTSHRLGQTIRRHSERLEHWVGFKPTALRICNPLHLITLPPVRYFYLHVLYTI